MAGVLHDRHPPPLSDARATVPDMQITEPDQAQYWHRIAAHTTADKDIGAPWPVHLQVAALIGNTDIDASVATFDGTGPSTWAVALITADTRLIRIRMQFDAENYDLEHDQSNATKTVEPKVNESWVRRLSDVQSLDVGGTRLRPDSFGRVMPNVLDVAGVTLTFRGGAVVDLGLDQLTMTMYDDRRRSDHFFDRLRHHTGL